MLFTVDQDRYVGLTCLAEVLKIQFDDSGRDFPIYNI